MLTTPEMAAVTSDRAWVQTMLDVELALATVEEEEGLIPAGVADAVRAVADVDRYDIATVGDKRDRGSPAQPQHDLHSDKQLWCHGLNGCR